MRRGLAGALAAGLLLGCAGSVDPEETRERSRLRELKYELDAAEKGALAAKDPAEQDEWLRLYDERRNALNRLYEERAQRLGGGSASPSTPDAATCRSRVVDDAIETVCR